MQEWKPVVTRVTETVLPNTQGRIERSFSIGFMVGPHGPFNLSVAAAAFRPDDIIAQLQAFAATINALPVEEAPAAPGA